MSNPYRPVTTASDWAHQPGNPLADIQQLVDELRKPPKYELPVVTQSQRRHLERIEISMCWSSCHRSWLETLKAWLRGAP